MIQNTVIDADMYVTVCNPEPQNDNGLTGVLEMETQCTFGRED